MQHTMSWLSNGGDTKLIYDPENKAEVKAAKVQFDTLVKEGFTAFNVKKSGKTGKKITEFDPKAGRIILRPPLAGG